MRKKMSIFKRLVINYGLVLVVVMVFVSVSMGIFVHSFNQSRMVGEVMALSDTIEHWTAAMHIDENDFRTRNAFKSTLEFWSNFMRADIVIVNNDGEITESTVMLDSVPQEYIKELETKKRIVRKGTFSGEYSKSVLTVGFPINYQGTKIGGAFFNLPLPELRRTAREIVYVIILSAAVSLLIAFVIIYFQSRSISKPIIEINDAVRDIAAGNFGKRVEINTGDEIGQLASSFNFMADSIENLEKQRSEFVSDVSHELRTPMTSISGFVEGILDGTIPPEKHEYYLNIVLEESRRLTKLVSDMLEISKMSASEYQLDITEFDLNELIRTCIIALESRICEKNLDLNVDFKTEDLKVLADKDSIKRVILNIMDNAIKFSYPNTTIGISTWLERHKAHVAIGNFGAGIAAKDISSIFNRFYKTDKSRATEKSGAGLGLSMVKNILVLHKQKIWVESVDAKEGSDVKYTKFTFTLEKS